LRALDMKHGIAMARSVAALAALCILTGSPMAKAQGLALNSQDLEIDQVMGVLSPDPVLMRLLTTEPLLPWHRGEQPFKQQPPAAQSDFRPVVVTPPAPAAPTMTAVMGAMGGAAPVVTPVTPVVVPAPTPAVMMTPTPMRMPDPTPGTPPVTPPDNERDRGGGTDGDADSPGGR